MIAPVLPSAFCLNRLQPPKDRAFHPCDFDDPINFDEAIASLRLSTSF
jgi:hypothetical protein